MFFKGFCFSADTSLFAFAAGVAGSKMVCTYTADKKNIAKVVWYNSRGDIAQQTEYTCLASKNPATIYPFSEVNKLDRGFVSQNAVQVAAISSPGYSPVSATDSYTYDRGGYPLTEQETYSNGDIPSVITYEYIEK